MKFFADTASLDDISELAQTGLLDGVTTNPSLIRKSGGDFYEVVTEITRIVEGPVSAETVATDHETMLEEGRKLAQIAKNIAVKVPLTVDGLKTCKALSGEGVMVNVTLCFSATQALLAGNADVEGVLIACTGLRAAALVGELERRSSVPVTKMIRASTFSSARYLRTLMPS